MSNFYQTNKIAIFKKAFILLLLTLSLTACTNAQEGSTSISTSDFEFISNDKTLSGVIDQPKNTETKAIIIFVHGNGRTNIREGWYLDLRERFGELGIASVVWDKPGTGRSEGSFNENQPLEACAQEVLDVIDYLQKTKIPGSNKIGVWSASRGSLIAPIAISGEPAIEFWISQSGPTAWDGKYYQLKENLPLDGYSQDEVKMLMDEWINGRKLIFEGADYDTYLAATENLRENPSVNYFAGDLTGTREEFNQEQKAFLAIEDQLEINENFEIARIQNFDKMLESLDIPVLALFGERDKNVNWLETKELYETTIGDNLNASLKVHAFPKGNHLINEAETGAMREVEESVMKGNGQRCKGYYKIQLEWLRENIFIE